MVHPSDTAALPAELLAGILEYLPVHELWTAARVSRQFYAAAWRAGLFIHREIEWTTDSGHADELAVFTDVVEHARRKDVLRLSLTLTCFPSDPRRRPDASFQSGADEFFPVVSASLPFLIFLSLDIPDHFRPQLDVTLRHPAPRLHTLEIDRISSQFPCTLSVPCDIFAGSAPLLRTITLRTVTLPDAAVPAFRAVRGLLKLELSLPALRTLHIDLRGHDAEPDMLQPPDYDDAALDVLSSSVWTPCPALERLTLFALHRPLTIDSRRIACLAHALGQLGRRVPLALVGVAFAEPVMRALLDQTVGTIRMHSFADRAFNDEGLWDFELFNRDL